MSAWVGLAELAVGGCTTSTDHLYVHPAGGGDLLSAEIEAARDLGVRFHPTRGSMSLSQKDGGLPPDSVVQDDDAILAASEEAVARHHDPAPGAMVRVALAPCSPFSVTPDLMRRTAELAERLDVRLHTHLAEDPDEDTFCLETFGRRPIEHFEDCGWGSDRSWVAHCIYPDEKEIARMGAWGTGVAHCPSSNMMIGGGGIAPVADYRAAGVPVGLGLRRLGVDRLRLAVARGPGRAAARPPAGRADVVHGPGRPRARHPRVGRLPRPARRAGRAGPGRGGRPGGVEARRPGVRRGAHRPGRGAAALRPDPGLPHGDRRPRRWSRTASCGSPACPTSWPATAAPPPASRAWSCKGRSPGRARGSVLRNGCPPTRSTHRTRTVGRRTGPRRLGHSPSVDSPACRSTGSTSRAPGTGWPSRSTRSSRRAAPRG